MIGGAERYVQALIPGLLERGHSVALLYEYPSDPKLETIDPPAPRLQSWCSADLAIEAVRSELAVWRPDVVYCHGLDDLRLERTLLEDHPSVLYAHTYYGTCISGRKCHALPQLAPCHRTLGAACLLLYFPRRCGGLNPGTMFRMFQEQTTRNAALRDYRAVLVASQHMHAEYARNGVAPDRLHLVPLPVMDATASDPPAFKAPGGSILFVGRLMDVKGAGNLIRAIPQAAQKLNRALSLTIAGDGPERANLEALAQRLNLPVKFLGWINAEKKHDLMRQADLLAVPSIWPEPFGLAGIEAGCFGLPAVGYDVGGIRAWLVPGESGELAGGDPPTVRGLADAMVRALADSVHYNQLRKGAWKNVARFQLDSHFAILEPILASFGSRVSPRERSVHEMKPIPEEAENRTTQYMGLKP